LEERRVGKESKFWRNPNQRKKNAAFSSGKVRPNHETNINIIARRTGKDVNSHTVLDGIITTIMSTIQRINIIGSREGSRTRRRLKANQTDKKFRVGIKSNLSTIRNNLISGVDRCIHLNEMKKTTITFFFSSRRRHTSLQGDWSSDVCSSDLQHRTQPALGGELRAFVEIGALVPQALRVGHDDERVLDGDAEDGDEAHRRRDGEGRVRDE